MAGFNYQIAPETGDYTIEGGQFVADRTARTPMILGLLDEAGRWWGDLEIGSEIAEVLRGQPPADPASALQDATERALAKLQELGRLASFAVEVEFDALGRPLITVDAIDGGSGLPVRLTVQPVGA